MKTALLAENNGLRTFVLVCETGDDAMKALTAFAADQRLGGFNESAGGGAQAGEPILADTDHRQPLFHALAPARALTAAAANALPPRRPLSTM